MTVPFYNKMFRCSGFQTDTDGFDQALNRDTFETAAVQRNQRMLPSLAVLIVCAGVATALAGLVSSSVAIMMQRVGNQWEHLAGAIVYDRTAAIDGIGQLVASLGELRTYPQFNADMRQWLTDTQAALLTLEQFLRDQRREEAWGQRAAIERLCEQCHQDYRLADIMRRMMDEYNQLADAFVRGRYERVVDGMRVLQGQTEWFRRWISADETAFHQEAQRLLDLASAIVHAAGLRDRSRTQRLLQQLIDSCPACHTAYRDTGRWRELAKRY
jgi:cytochrome c556